MNKKITVLYDGSAYTLTWLRALIWAKKEFGKHSVQIEFYGPSAYVPSRLIDNRKFDVKNVKKYCDENKLDIVFVAFHHDSGISALSVEERKEVLTFIKNRCRKLIWLDTSDSSGTALFDVLPYVDYFLKKQVLKDLNQYRKETYGGRKYCEFYHEKLGINDKDLESKRFPVMDPQYKDKIKLSWNVGLGDLFSSTKKDKLLCRSHYPKYQFREPSQTRKFDTHYRGSAWKSLAGFQRKKISDLLLESSDRLAMPDVSKMVPKEEYIREMMESRSVFSPFGWGEVCTRDFEAFVYGAALIKPDMSHLITYPAWYEDGETYLSLNWDFSDFYDIVELLLSEKGKRQINEIATKGQEKYRSYIIGGQNKFVEHLLYQIEEL